MITLSHSTVVSNPYPCRPNGSMTAKGVVNIFENRFADKYNPVKVNELKITNDNGVVFFESHKGLSVDTIRAISEALTEIADNAEKANNMMIALDKSENVSTK